MCNRGVASRDTQQKILERAVALFNEHGVGPVSLNRIAESLQISGGNLHYHFRTKDELVRAIFDRIRAEPLQVTSADLMTPTVAHMRFMFERYSQLVWSYRFFFRELTTLVQNDPLLRQRYFENRRLRLGVLERFFERLVSVGVMRRPEPPITIASLVQLSWIVSDTWLFYEAPEPGHLDSLRMDMGYQLLLAVFAPYMLVPTDAPRTRADCG